MTGEIDKLEASINAAKKKNTIAVEGTKPDPNIIASKNAAIEIFSGTLVGCFVGYQLDQWLETKPVFFLICMLLGIAGSGLNIYKIVKRMSSR